MEVKFKRKKVSLCTLAIAAGIGLLSFSTAGQAAEVVQQNEHSIVTKSNQRSVALPAKISGIFPDVVIAKTIASLLGKNVDDTVTQDDLNGVTRLYINQPGVSNLEGVQYLKKMYVLTLVNSNLKKDARAIEDLTPLSDLTELKFLVVENHRVRDLSPLKNLPLERLALPYNQLSDISSMKDMTKSYKSLTELDLSSNNIYDLKPLAEFEGLKIIFLQRNNISEVETLSTFAHDQVISILDLSDNHIHDFSFLNTKYIQELRAENQTIHLPASLTTSVPLAIKGEKGAAQMEVTGTGYRNGMLYWFNDAGENVARFTNGCTTKSCIGGTVTQKVGKEWPLKQIFSSSSLTYAIAKKLGKTSDDSVTLAELQAFSDLDFGADQTVPEYLKFHDLTGIHNFTELKTLNITNNKVKSLEPVRGLSKLTELHANNNEINSIEPLADSAALTTVSLNENHIHDISALKHVSWVAAGFQKIKLPLTRFSRHPIRIRDSEEAIPQLNFGEAGGKYVDDHLVWEQSGLNQVSFESRKDNGVIDGIITQYLQ